MEKVKSLLDVMPKAVTKVKSLPTGKPLFRTVYTNGCFRQITYIFKGGVYIRNMLKGKEMIFLKKPEIVTSKGLFLN